MKRAIAMLLVVLTNFIFQTSFLESLAINDIKPNTALLIVISYAILRGDMEGSILGFAAGILQDIFFGKYLGFYALCYSLTGYFCGKPFKDFYLDNYWLPAFLAMLFSILNDTFFYFVNHFFRARLDIALYFSEIIIPSAIYNIALSWLFYGIIYLINQRVEKLEGS